MFQPQPTPFASSSFVSYGLASDLDFAYPVSAGGGFYNSSAPAPAPAPASVPATSQQLSQSHSQSHPTLQSQSQSRSQPQSQPPLIQQRIPRQQLSPSAVAPSVSPPYSTSQNSNSESSSSPTLAQPQTRQSLPHQQLGVLSRQQPAQQQQYATQSGSALLKMDEQGLHGFNAQQAAAQDYQAELEVNDIVAELSPLPSRHLLRR